MMRKQSFITGGLLCVLLLSGCGGGSNESEESAPESPAATEEMTQATGATTSETPEGSGSASATASETATQDSSESPSGESSEASTDGSSPEADSSPGAVVLSPDKKGQTLALADFFSPDSEWTENRYDVADEGAVSGISRDISTCGSNYSTSSLELRLANNFETLNFRVGQANTSEASDQNLVVRVEGNGKQLDVQRIPFNQIQEFSVPVEGVNAAIMQFYLDDEMEGCGSGDVQAVVYDAELQ